MLIDYELNVFGEAILLNPARSVCQVCVLIDYEPTATMESRLVHAGTIAFALNMHTKPRLVIYPSSHHVNTLFAPTMQVHVLRCNLFRAE